MSNFTIGSNKVNAGNISGIAKYHESEQNFDEQGQAIGSGADDYFSRPEETGQAAKYVGGFNPNLDKYEMGDYEKVMQGYNPRTGEDLLTASRRKLLDADLNNGTAKQTLGFSTTFNLSKSISLLYASGSPEEQAAIEKAAMNANKLVWEYAENNGIITTRTGEKGVNVHAAKMLAMSFLHITSRNLDPQLHIHNEIANYARFTDENGQSRVNTLNAGDIYKRQKELAALFDIILRNNINKELNINPEENFLYADFADKDKGLKVNGITKEACDKYSSRRAEIVKALKETGGIGNADAARNAALNTRQDKKETDISIVKEEWREDLKDEKPEALTEEFKNPTLLAVEAEIFKGGSIFGEPDLDRVAAQLTLAAGNNLEDIKAWKERVINDLGVLNLGDGIYTTEDMLKLESEIVRFAIRGARPSTVFNNFEIPDETVNNALKAAQESKGFKLRDEQVDALQNAVKNNQFSIIQGAAGVGKSVSLEVLNLAIENDNKNTGKNRKIIGLAPSGAAGAELQKSAKIDSGTAHSFLLKYEQAETQEKRKELLTAGDYIVVDEAGMLDTRTLHKLSKVAAETQSKLILVGDAYQLDSVGSASLFANLQDKIDKAEIKQISRQKDPRLAAISQAFFDGKPGSGLNKMIDFIAEPDSRQLLHLNDQEQIRKDIINRFEALLKSGETAAETLLLADKNADVLDLNYKAREIYAEQGYINLDSSVTRSCKLQEGDEYNIELTPGDRILLRQNAKIGDEETQVYNGDRATVVNANKNGELTIKLDRGEQVTLPPDYQAIQYGYALTVHKSQGMTVNNALYLTSETTDRRSAYVAFTRARNGGEFYTDSEQLSALIDNTKDFKAKQTALSAAGLLNVIAQEDIKTPAVFNAKQPGVLEILEQSGPAISSPGNPEPAKPAANQNAPAPLIYQPHPSAQPATPQPPEPPASPNPRPSDPAERDLNHLIHGGFSSGAPAWPLAGYTSKTAGVYRQPPGDQPPEIRGTAGLYHRPAASGHGQKLEIYANPPAAASGKKSAVCVAPSTQEPSPAALVALDKATAAADKITLNLDPAEAPELAKTAEIQAFKHGADFQTAPPDNLKNDLNQMADASLSAAGHLAAFAYNALLEGFELINSTTSAEPSASQINQEAESMAAADNLDPSDVGNLPLNKAARKLKLEAMRKRKQEQQAAAAFKMPKLRPSSTPTTPRKPTGPSR